VGGALNDRNGRASGVVLAQRLAADFTAIAYDRRGRGASIASGPSTAAREVEDLRALIETAGGSAALFGMSSGGALALAVAAAGPGVTRIAIYEPPFAAGPAEQAHAKAYDARLTTLLAAGDNDAALTLFLAAVGMPPAMVEDMRKGPGWRPMAALALTLAQDSAILDEAAGAPVPVARIAAIAAPILVLAGERSPPHMQQAAATVAKAARRGAYQILPGQTHAVTVEALAPALLAFFSATR
jgi:pimeloyl-ACP methyl ester carboxylesterase